MVVIKVSLDDFYLSLQSQEAGGCGVQAGEACALGVHAGDDAVWCAPDAGGGGPDRPDRPATPVRNTFFSHL